MTKVQYIIHAISKLTSTEREEVIETLSKKTEEEQQLQVILDEFIGIGQGVWFKDAEDYIQTLREDDRN